MKKPGTKTKPNILQDGSSDDCVERSQPFPRAGGLGCRSTRGAGKEKYGEKQEPGHVQIGGLVLVH